MARTLLLPVDNVPQSHKEAMQSREKEQWMAAELKELEHCARNQHGNLQDAVGHTPRKQTPKVMLLGTKRGGYVKDTHS